MFAGDVAWMITWKHSCDFYSADGGPAYSEEAAVQQLNSLFICFMDRHNSDIDTDYFDSCFSAMQQEHSYCYFSPACFHSSLQCWKAPAGLQMRLLIRGSGCPQPWYTRTPPCEPAQDPCPCPSSINFVRGIMGSFGRPFSPRKAAVGLWLEGACTTWALLHGVCMLTLSPGFRRQPPFFRDSHCPSAWHGVKPRCRGGSAPLSVRDRLWQARSVGRGRVQMLLWPRCPPVCCLPSGVGTCSKKEMSKKKKKNRGVCFYLSQTGIRNWQCWSSEHFSQTLWAQWGCQELTGAWPWLKQVLQAKFTWIHLSLWQEQFNNSRFLCCCSKGNNTLKLMLGLIFQVYNEWLSGQTALGSDLNLNSKQSFNYCQKEQKGNAK